MQRVNQTELFLQELQKFNPKFQIKPKADSWLMKLLAKVLFFNPKFSKYYTTIGNTVYVPERWKTATDEDKMSVLAHEFVHARDNQKLGLKFQIMYLFPQILALVFPVLFFFFPWYVVIPLIVGSLFPWPAPGRKHLEIRGYTTNLLMYNLRAKLFQVSARKRLNHMKLMSKNISDKQFESAAYYYMWPFGVKKQLEEQAYRIVNSKLELEDDIYAEVIAAFEATIPSVYEP